ncbi:MAG: zinc ribbon domain-containing protein, partial [Gemmatimonadetes bacterium]|nr:zinc ribbon domain-containing protein [Gemmatimonadota bacterium]
MDPLDRLYWRLVESLRRERPGDAWEMTIAEIYQQYVPYRTVRAELGFAELAAYEHALLRLLAGEKEYVSLDLPEVQDELRRELRAPNPILGLYRDYAAVGVRVNPASLAMSPSLAPPPAVPAMRVAPPPPAQAPEPAARSVPVEDRTEEPPRRPTLCRGCRTPLPEGREVRFCPFCGTTQRALPCQECGEMVEPDWKFCVSCGTPQQSPATPQAERGGGREA